MQINRVQLIHFGTGFEGEQLDDCDWRPNHDLPSRDCIAIYEKYEDEDSDDLEPVAWAYFPEEGESTVHMQADSDLFSLALDDTSSHFKNQDLVKRALFMGYLNWEDEFEFDPDDEILVEAIGEDSGGELNLSDHEDQIREVMGSLVIVSRSVFVGADNLSAEDLKDQGISCPDDFEPADELEAVRAIFAAD